MQIIPVAPVANQTLNIVLNDQSTTLNIYTLSTGIFMDVLLNGTLIIGGVVCLNRTLIIINQYLGYSGDFMWVDITNSVVDVKNESSGLFNHILVGNDPVYTGLGTQYVLYYLGPQNLQFFGLGA